MCRERYIDRDIHIRILVGTASGAASQARSGEAWAPAVRPEKGAAAAVWEGRAVAIPFC